MTSTEKARLGDGVEVGVGDRAYVVKNGELVTMTVDEIVVADGADDAFVFYGSRGYSACELYSSALRAVQFYRAELLGEIVSQDRRIEELRGRLRTANRMLSDIASGVLP